MKSNELGFEIVKPTLILDKNTVLKNIEEMADKAKSSGVRFRPHFKTHQSTEIGNWFRDFGVEAITVSSLDMAKYFTDNGWSDITVAFIANVLEISKINSLADKITLNLLVDSKETLSALETKLQQRVGMWIKIDTGYHRTGISWEDFKAIRSLAHKIKDSPKTDFKGLLVHAGHSYHAKSVSEIRKIHVETLLRLSAAKEFLETSGVEACDTSVGDTPTCSVVDDFQGLDEIRPGNFVFYDLMQEKLGACTEDEIAVAVACPVVGKYKDRNQIAVYGGAVHLSTAYIVDDSGRQVFGYATSLRNGSFGPTDLEAPVISLSQEHGMLQVDHKLFEKVKIADLLLVFPVHSCLTSSLHSGYRTLEGKAISRLQES
ncbi:MAG: alanine racemase [candidate division Zixibacteria bacterium]|nr:alanine racemase [candidate division Zixibacteria bacterium]